MTKNLLIVESPSKARTIKKYLGKDFQVLASVGHIKDLPEKELGIDIKKDFKPKYVTIAGKTKIIHVVKKGETLGEIADAYKVGLSNLRAWNNLYGSRFIYPGQKIVIYKSTGS